MTAVESQLKAAETERNSLSQRLEELEGQLSKITATHSAALDKLEEQLAEREMRLAERAEEKVRIDGEHDAALEQLRLERDELAGNLDELRGRLGETAAGHEAALARLEEQLVEREHRLAKRSDERASIEQEHRAALDELVLERNTLAANFEELQGLMSDTTAAHETAFAKLEEQLATRERVLADRTEEVARLTQEREAALEELEQERVRAAEAAAALVVPDETMHVLLVPAFTGYMLLERTGPAPDAREVVEIGPGTWGEGRFVVSKIGPSPLPDGPKHCAFLEQA